MCVASNVNNPSTRVVETVADCEQVSPFTLSPPLATFVDPDALDALLDQCQATVTFVAWGYRITASDEGVTIETGPTEAATTSRLADD